MKRFISITLLLLPLYIFPESEIGVISVALYEYYQEPVLLSLENTPISKPMVSITPQFIWKDNRNMVLLNIELFGSLGSLNGSFGKDGALSGQLKADSFYVGYLPETDIYLKFGKYSINIPFGFPVRVATGQFEIGLDGEELDLFSSIIYYNLFNQFQDDGSYIFKNERFNSDNKYILNSGLNLHKLGLALRLPIELNRDLEVESFHPTITFNKKINSFNNSTFIGLSLRENKAIIGIREELGITYDSFSTHLLLSYLSTNNSKEYGFNYTSIDNKYLDFHYGSHFNYLYQNAANIYGMSSIGLKQVGQLLNSDFWISYSGHFTIDNYIAENRDNNFIGSIVSTGLKFYDLWSTSTLLELYASVFIPGGFSVINTQQQNDIGFQLVIKLQHIIF